MKAIAKLGIYMLEDGRVATEVAVPNEVILEGMIALGVAEIRATMARKKEAVAKGSDIEIAPANSPILRATG